MQLERSSVTSFLTHVNMTESVQIAKLLDKLRLQEYRIKDAALYPCISRQRLNSVSSNPLHYKLWDCAVDRIPSCSGTLRRDLYQVSTNRSQTLKQKTPNSIQLKFEFAVGFIVVCDKDADIADYGDDGQIAGLREANGTVENFVSILGAVKTSSLSINSTSFSNYK